MSFQLQGAFVPRCDHKATKHDAGQATRFQDRLCEIDWRRGRRPAEMLVGWALSGSLTSANPSPPPGTAVCLDNNVWQEPRAPEKGCRAQALERILTQAVGKGVDQSLRVSIDHERGPKRDRPLIDGSRIYLVTQTANGLVPVEHGAAVPSVASAGGHYGEVVRGCPESGGSHQLLASCVF